MRLPGFSGGPVVARLLPPIRMFGGRCFQVGQDLPFRVVFRSCPGLVRSGCPRGLRPRTWLGAQAPGGKWDVTGAPRRASAETSIFPGPRIRVSPCLAGEPSTSSPAASTAGLALLPSPCFRGKRVWVFAAPPFVPAVFGFSIKSVPQSPGKGKNAPGVLTLLSPWDTLLANLPREEQPWRRKKNDCGY